ncbi:MAG: IS1 family transposase, partial [Xenococcus sp. (in: cyanobacteria)]
KLITLIISINFFDNCLIILYYNCFINLLLKLIITDLPEKSKTNCLQWHTDGWGSYERVFGSEIRQIIGKDKTQTLEKTNGILRQQIVRWHRSQNKFVKVWAQTEATVQLMI